MATNAAAIPAAVWKNARRLTPWRRASRSPSSAIRASTRFCRAVWGGGVNSSLDTNWVGMGPANAVVSAGSRSSKSRAMTLSFPGLLHGGECGRTQHRDRHLLDDGPVLLAL